jgi:hypothetical protein
MGPVFLKIKAFDDGYSPKTRFFEMHHTIVKTLQNRRIGFGKCRWRAAFKKSGLKLTNTVICRI